MGKLLSKKEHITGWVGFSPRTKLNPKPGWSLHWLTILYCLFMGVQQQTWSEEMSAQSVVLYSSLLSASHWYYHIIISPNSMKSLNHCDVGRKQGHEMNGSVKAGDNNSSLWMWAIWDRGKSIVTNSEFLLLLLRYSKTKVKHFSRCNGKPLGWVCSSCFGFLPHPSHPARRLSCHCGCGMLETQWTRATLPLAPFLYCGTRWEEMLGQSKLN